MEKIVTTILSGLLIAHIAFVFIQSYRYSQQGDSGSSRIYFFFECLFVIALLDIVPSILVFLQLMSCLVGCTDQNEILQLIAAGLALISIIIYPYSVVQKSKETLITLNISLVAKIAIVLSVIIFIGNMFIF